jgi:hypothetical protein
LLGQCWQQPKFGASSMAFARKLHENLFWIVYIFLVVCSGISICGILLKYIYDGTWEGFITTQDNVSQHSDQLLQLVMFAFQ